MKSVKKLQHKKKNLKNTKKRIRRNKSKKIIGGKMKKFKGGEGSYTLITFNILEGGSVPNTSDTTGLTACPCPWPWSSAIFICKH